MAYNLGTRLRVDGDNYVIIGRIKYCNLNDMNATWTEYALRSENGGEDRWLSYDELYQEYSISRIAGYEVPTDDYHIVDQGRQRAIEVLGSVDVDCGEEAAFREYEDSTEEKIISVEKWSDGEEYSTGYYLDIDEIEMLSGAASNMGGNTSYSYETYTPDKKPNKKKSSNLFLSIFIIFFASSYLLPLFSNFLPSESDTTISEYLSDSANYTYTTSITGENNQKADVYSTTLPLDSAVRSVISGIDGKTEDVTQNTEDGDTSVAILTGSEYCIVYTSDDAKTMLQVSDREYAYSSDKDLYRGNMASNRYYRRYYYSRGYSKDSSRYSSYSSPYSSYSDSTIVSTGTSTYNSYASSVRQSSTRSRRASGGGLSSGK